MGNHYLMVRTGRFDSFYTALKIFIIFGKQLKNGQITNYFTNLSICNVLDIDFNEAFIAILVQLFRFILSEFLWNFHIRAPHTGQSLHMAWNVTRWPICCFCYWNILGILVFETICYLFMSYIQYIQCRKHNMMDRIYNANYLLSLFRPLMNTSCFKFAQYPYWKYPLNENVYSSFFWIHPMPR